LLEITFNLLIVDKRQNFLMHGIGVEGFELQDSSMFADMDDLTNDVSKLKAEHRTFGSGN